MPRPMVTITNDETGHTTQVAVEAAGYFAGYRVVDPSEVAPAPAALPLPTPQGDTPKPFVRRDAAKNDKE